MRKSRFSKVLALTLVFVMVMSSVASAAPVGTRISNILSATFTVTDPVITEANVSSLSELEGALKDDNIITINIIKDISATAPIVVNSEVTINGGGHTLSFTGLESIPSDNQVDDGLIINAPATVDNLVVDAGLPDKTLWVGTYAIHVYNTTATLSNITATGGNGGILVNGSTVTMTGTIDVSDNGFGGIESSIGSGVQTTPSLTVTGVTAFKNTTEAYSLPTIWEDGITGTVQHTNLTKITFRKSDGKTQDQYYIVGENSIDQVTNAIAAVNAATDVITVRQAFVKYSSVIGIDSSIMTIFNEMPEDQGRQQAVAAAVMMFKYNNIIEIKTVFEGSVNKEYAKMMFINAVDGAKNADDMKVALGEPLKSIHANRQNLISQLERVGGHEDLVAVLAASTYTKVLEQVNGMTSETELISLAKALYGKRAADGKFYGVENIINAIDNILNSDPGEYVKLDFVEGFTGAIAATAGQSIELKVTATVKNATNLNYPVLTVAGAESYEISNSGNIDKNITAGQVFTITFTFPTSGTFDVDIFVVEGEKE